MNKLDELYKLQDMIFEFVTQQILDEENFDRYIKIVPAKDVDDFEFFITKKTKDNSNKYLLKSLIYEDSGEYFADTEKCNTIALNYVNL